MKNELGHYDDILRSMNQGLVITLNNQENTGATPSDELTVKSSISDETVVNATALGERWIKIHRNDAAELVYSEVTEKGLSQIDEVITIEIVGIAGAE